MKRDRATFQRLLAEGLSVDAIGERLDLTPSTVSWWLTRHGLESNGRARFGPKPALDADALAALVAEGHGVVEIARRLGVTPGRVRRALASAGLQTSAGRRRESSEQARAAGTDEALLDCPRHGQQRHVRGRRGAFRCVVCRTEAVVRRRREVKRILVEEAGGRCRVCGYDRCQAALQFHHLDPAEKAFVISLRGAARSIAAVRAEARKCVLLCANCHAEVEAGVTSLTPRGGLEPPNLD